MGVGIRLPRRAEEAAKFAIGVTDIRRIEMSIDVEVRGAPVPLPSHYVCQLSESRQIVSSIKSHTVFE
jgi:hypothetical protein